MKTILAIYLVEATLKLTKTISSAQGRHRRSKADCGQSVLHKCLWLASQRPQHPGCLQFVRKPDCSATRFISSPPGVRTVWHLKSLLVYSLCGAKTCVDRQGVLPYPRFWASTKPFGTPLGPYLVKWSLTVIMILAPPAGDAFSFITDLSVYPSSFFAFLLSVGLFLVRHRRKKLNLPRPAFRAWDVTVIFTILVNLFLLIMPWYPPTGGIYAGDVSFLYCAYVITGIGM